jgi:tetratricopeptide (TPR) repeat protein
MGDDTQALPYYQESLPIRREVGDLEGEALTVYNIGAAYYNLGNDQQALTYFTQALPLLQSIGDQGRAGAVSEVIQLLGGNP